ncbi:MAG TPA: iron ABC transporter permease [Nitrospirae bacterium]|nr:hemin transport system permease protein HmuU [bacterium BMS3Bbin09]HDH34541.1 iron ABC transporter permease [Nitrospirota bacterium]HDZ84354.1 iron ABC transporter permease [Nitrospirota bacterium]
MKIKFFLIILSALAVFSIALFCGPKWISPMGLSDMDRQILLSIRLPRVVVSVLMGMALGASGAVLQGVLRNPLADPYILGISSGAALIAAAGIIFGVTIFGVFTIPVLAFAGAMVTGIFVGAMGWKRGGFWPDRLLLAGVGLGFLFSALLMLLMSVSSNEGLKRAILWIYGDLSITDWSIIPYGVIFIAVGLAIAFSRAKALNSLMLGDDLAHSLGFSPGKERFILFIAVSLMTAASVALGGMIGFIGLLIPHIGRFVVGSDSRVLIPASALGGGMLLCIADLIGKSIVSPMELPAGIITAILGAPYFLYLLRKRDVLSI